MLKVGARSSPLSRAQVEEVQKEFGLEFDVQWVETRGDKDRITSLRDLDRTDFFTRELDEMLLRGDVDAVIHSAKDLPDPMPDGLEVVILTKGLDPRDSLVYKKLPIEVVATSSERREDAVRKLFPKCSFVDLRGTIHERLLYLEGDVDGVVVAEAALIRLKLTHLNRIFLPGTTTDLQGRLAIVCRKNSTSVFAQKRELSTIR